MTDSVFKKTTLKKIHEEIREVYLSDNRPWIIGFSGGKDSTAVAQLTWMAIEQLPRSKRKKPVFIVTTDTMVENPIVSNWVESSLDKMKIAAKEKDLSDHLLFLIGGEGMGYSYKADEWQHLINSIKQLHKATNLPITIVTSRRSDPEVEKKIKRGH